MSIIFLYFFDGNFNLIFFILFFVIFVRPGGRKKKTFIGLAFKYGAGEGT